MSYSEAIQRQPTQYTYQTSSRTYQEVECDRKNTITLTSEDGQKEAQQIFTYLKNLNLLSHIRCIQILEARNRIEITTTDETNNSEFADTLFRQQVIINGIHLKLASSRKFMDIVKIPIIKVTIFEAPFELENE